MKELYQSERVEMYHTEEDGICGWGKCPDCGDDFYCYDLSDDDPVCECGVRWSLTMRITGSK